MKTKLSRIKSGIFSRGLALAKVSAQASTRAAAHAVGNLFASEDSKPERLKQMLIDQMGILVGELGQLKGSLMKVGQMLSVVGEHFLPPEANQILKSLQSESPPLEWAAIEKVLKRQLGTEKLALLDIDPEPWAAASLGQVHRAKLKSGGRSLALKIQYPGVDQAIEGDLRALKSILALAKVLPDRKKFEEIFREVRTMLHQEVDYARELSNTEEFQLILAPDSRFVVPLVFPEFSTRRVLATSFEEGIPLDHPDVLGLSQERRNQLGQAFLELYFRELFELGMVQTDPHFGNYRVRLGNPDRWVLLDFGAVRKFDEKFLRVYRELVRASILRDRERVIRSCTEMGFLRPDDSEALCTRFADVCFMLSEPLHGDPDASYDWGASDLAKRATLEAKKLAVQFRLRAPPREVVFLDRKMAGVFTVLHVLKARFGSRQLLDPYLRD